MIRTSFQPPNFRCVFSTDAPGAQDEEMVTCALDESTLRARLEADKFVVRSITPFDFAAWLQAATTARANACAVPPAGAARPFNSDIWSQLKSHLFSLFHGKCGYCESFVLNVDYGDVEHYRPKRKVEEDPQHPGYYWLAYETSNLIPCCAKCNRARGKQNHFPVFDNYVRDPAGDLASERPKLLHPYEDDPKKHLKFLPSIPDAGAPGKRSFMGTVAAICGDERGVASIETYNLNRNALVIDRRKAQEIARQAIKLAVVNETLLETLAKFRSPVTEHSAACMAEIDAWIGEFSAQARPS